MFFSSQKYLPETAKIIGLLHDKKNKTKEFDFLTINSIDLNIGDSKYGNFINYDIGYDEEVNCIDVFR